MRIAKVLLQNVKSYGGATTIELTTGINAVCGENGAGKSTILEAIGYALFGYKPYRLDAFLREGEKNGSIVVTVEDDDGVSYDVVRKLGTSSGQAVYNELAQRIAEGETDVRAWLLDFFRLEPGTDIAKLFEDTVGPPQGTLTAIFLESAGPRSKKFDRLLGIEDYATAAQALKGVSNLFRDEAEDAERRAAVLEGDARRLPEVEGRQAELVRRQAALGLELEGLRQEQEALAGKRDLLDRARQAIQAAEAALSVAEARSSEARRRQEELAAELAQAEEAARVVEESRPGYQACQEATGLLRQLEVRRKERDTLRQKAETAGRNALQWKQQVQAVSEQLAALARDEARAAELELLVPEQERREGSAREAEERLRARDEAAHQLTTAEERSRAAEGRLQEATRRLVEVEEAKPVAAGLATLRDQERALRDSRARLEQQSLALKQGAEGLVEAKGRLGRLRQDMEQLGKQVETLRPLEPLASQSPARQQERDGVASTLAALEARHKEALRTRGQVEGGLCPFFHERCLNLREGLSLDTHFDGVIAATSAELGMARGRLSAVDSSLAEARAAERAFSRLPDLERQLQHLGEARAKLEEELGRVERQQLELAAIPREQARLEGELRALEPRLTQAEAAWKAASGEAGWRSQAEEAFQSLERERKTMDKLHSPVQAGAGAEEAVAATHAALAELGDPRGEAALLRGRVTRERPAAERALERAQRDEAAARAVEEDAKKALEPYTRLEEEIAAATARRDASQPSHNRFLASEVEASRLGQRRLSHDKATREADQAKTALSAAAETAEGLRASYDEAGHLRLRHLLEEAGAKIAGARMELDLKRSEEERLQEELALLRKSKDEMEVIQRQAQGSRRLRDTVEAVRLALDAAGPEIGRALLRRISDRATGLYRDLLGQPAVSLEWGTDYEIRTRIRTEEREFKQLSGGEQMAAALAVRLALLQTISNLRVAFLDEPTAHMDATRRTNLAAQIQNLRSFDQLVVISHDDSFDTLFGHVVRLVKRDGVTVVEP